MVYENLLCKYNIMLYNNSRISIATTVYTACQEVHYLLLKEYTK